MKTRSAIAFAAVVVSAALPLACGKDKPPENPQPFVPQNTGGYPSTPTDQYDAGTTAPAAQPDAAPAPTTAQAGPLDPAIREVLKTALRPLAAQHAANMKAEGDIIGGALQEGQTIETQTMLQPGKCYTVVGTSLPMIQELDIQMYLVPSIPGMPPMAIDTTTGTTAVLAGSPNCYKYALPLPAMVRIVVKATSGSGAAGAQIYVK